MPNAAKLALLPLLFLTFHCTCGHAQCDGNLGENIFTDGDFGSGTANVPAQDPGIAPGFIYQRLPPPSDGFYTITNDMRRWANIFGTWDAFADNSNDPNGYMMVVNAAFEPGKFYEQTVTGLCEDTEYQFTADLRNIIKRGTGDILPNVSFLIDDVSRFTTGDIPETETWNTYGFSFRTGPNQTEVLLALSNNAPGGIGNDLAIDNIEFRACGPLALIDGGESLVQVCQNGEPEPLRVDIIGDQYDNPVVQWQRSSDGGLTWQDLAGANDTILFHTNQAIGFYYYRYLLANGTPNLANSRCRVVSNEKIVEVIPIDYAVTDTICNGLTYAVGNSTYTQTGVYRDTLLNSLGCDSIVTLTLQVVPDPGLVADVSVTFPTCAELDDGSFTITGVPNAVPPFRLFFEDSLRAERSFANLGEGTYNYRIVDRFGCAVTDSVDLRSPAPFTVTLGGDRQVNLGDPLRLNVASDDTVSVYQFTPDLGCPPDSNCAQLTAFLTESGIIRLDAVSDNGCLASDSLFVAVVKDYDIYEPNIFSPNADGVNDLFLPLAEAPRLRAINNFGIYSRWGEEVYFVPRISPELGPNGWDGTFRGRPAPIGIYVYQAELEFLDGTTRQIQGSVSLVR